MVARRAHNPKVASSSLASATMNPVNQAFTGSFLVLWNGVEREFSVEKYKHESNAHQVVQQVKADDGTACPPNDVYQNGQAAAAAVLGIERRQPGPPGDSGEKLRKPTVPSLADGHQPIGGQLLQKEGKGQGGGSAEEGGGLPEDPAVPGGPGLFPILVAGKGFQGVGLFSENEHRILSVAPQGGPGAFFHCTTDLGK